MVSGIVAGRLAVITGAGSGIGRATCRVLSREGATVIAADKNFDTALKAINNHTSLASSVFDARATHSAVEVDVSDSNSIQNALKTILKQYGKPPTIVVNCAGITKDHWMIKMSEEDFDAVLNVNLKGTWLMTQAFANAMMEAGLPGAVVNISSLAGKLGNMGQTNYASSKAGVVGFTSSAAKELGKFNIRVNCILPAFIESPIIKNAPEKVMQAFVSRIPLGRKGKPDEIAEAIAFLSSDKSSYITGASLDIAGGFELLKIYTYYKLL